MRKEWRTEALVLRALIIGFTHIDTAAQPSQYREELVGEAIRLWVLAGKPREQLFV
jgi:diketogulonate reductase-like aldo/keto reductase